MHGGHFYSGSGSGKSSGGKPKKQSHGVSGKGKKTNKGKKSGGMYKSKTKAK